MHKTLAIAAVLTLAAAPLTAGAETFALNLHKVDLTTDAGMASAKRAVLDAAHAYCGPVDMLQPLELRSARVTCQSDLTRQAMAAIETARKKQVAALAPQTLAAR